eukprot:g5468.t1
MKPSSPGNRGGGPSPYDKAWCWGHITFSYAGPLLRRGRAAALTPGDLDNVATRDAATRQVGRLEAAWERELRRHPKSPSLWRAIYNCQTREFWMAALHCLLESVFRVAQPVCLRFLISWLRNQRLDDPLSLPHENQTAPPSPPSSSGAAVGGIEVGLLWAAALMVCGLGQAVIHHQLYLYTMRAGWNLRIATTGLMHEKLLRLRNTEPSLGKTINIVASDTQRFDNFLPGMHFAWSGILDLVAVGALMINEIGTWPAVGGISVVLVMLPILLVFGKRFAIQRRRTARYTDKRVRTITEAFGGIVTTKAACWESRTAHQVAEERKQEQRSIFISMSMKSFNLAVYFATPYLAALVTFVIVFAMDDAPLQVDRVMGTLSLIHVLRMSIGKHFTRAIEMGPECAVAVDRMRRFLLLPEVTTSGSESRLGVAAAGSAAGSEASKSEGAAPAAPAGVGRGAKVVDVSVATEAKAQAEAGAKAAATAAAAALTPASSDLALSLTNASFAWGPDLPDVLTGVTLRVPRGRLVVVLGPCGAGKSSLLHAILGELLLKAGACDTAAAGRGAGGGGGGRGDRGDRGDRGVGYAAQQACITAGTFRSNVCFGLPLEEPWYTRVVSACALDRDVAQLPNGHDTEIGDRGVNLSGGQKARVGLARAVYSRAPLCLLDDPLSAVDPPVGRHLFHEGICGLLRNEPAIDGGPRTAVLVTHHEGFAPYADTVLRLGENGTVVSVTDQVAAASVPPKETKEPPPEREGEGEGEGKNEEGVEGQGQEQEQEEEKSSSSKAPLAPATATGTATGTSTGTATATPATGKLVHSEERNVGHVSWRTYLAYARSGGLASSLIVILLFAAGQAVAICADWWLKDWGEASPADQRDTARFMWPFVALTLSASVIAIVRAVVFFAVGLRAATGLHRKALWAVLRSPWRFFSANPLGRIINKFSSDQGQIDELLPISLFDTIQIGFLVLGSLVLCCIAVPYIAAGLLPLLVLFVLIRRHFLFSSRELKRLESITKSPIFGTFTSSIQGLVTVRAFAAERRVQARMLEALDAHGRAWFSWLLVNRWVGFRLDMLSWLVLAGVSFGVVGLHESIDPGTAGLAIVYALSLSGFFQYMVRQSALVETQMTS